MENALHLGPDIHFLLKEKFTKLISYLKGLYSSPCFGLIVYTENMAFWLA